MMENDKRPTWQSPYDFERAKREAEREAELLKEAIELRNEFIETSDGFSETKEKHVFKAVEKDGQIAVFLTNEHLNMHLFCDFLRTKEELDLFFTSIDVEEYIITNEMCGGHYYEYGENPKAESITVQFFVHEIINGIDREICFSDGMWSTTMDNEELVGDFGTFSRAEYIKEFQNKSAR